MTVLALDLVLPGMDIVTKEDRLAGATQTSGIARSESRCESGVGFGGGLLGEGPGPAEREESSQASGCNATDDESQLTHHHLTAEEDLGPASGKCAPKYSAAISLHNPTNDVIRLIQSASAAPFPPWRRGARRGAGRSASHSTFRRARLRKASMERRSVSSSQHHFTGPVRCPSTSARAMTPATFVPLVSRLSSLSDSVKVTSTLFFIKCSQHTL